MKAMIFAAGLGTRLRPLTDTMPKALVPISGKPMLKWQIDKLKEAGIKKIVVNIHHLGGQIRQYLQANDNFGCDILLSDESGQLLETGGGLKKASQIIGTDEPLLALNVDVLSNISIPALIKNHREDSLATLVVSQRQTQRYLLFDSENNLKGWTNIATGEYKPKDRQNTLQAAFQAGELTKLAFSGMHIISPALFPMMDKEPDVFPIMDLYLNLCDRFHIRGYIPDDYRMMDVGKAGEIDKAEEFAKTLL